MENPELVMDATLTTKFTHSGYDSAAVKIVEEFFIKKLKENQEISVETGFDYNTTEQVADTAPYPIVCIISGKSEQYRSNQGNCRYTDPGECRISI